MCVRTVGSFIIFCTVAAYPFPKEYKDGYYHTSFYVEKMVAPNFLLSVPSLSHPPVKIYCRSSETRTNTAQKLPPGPRKLPVIGNLHNLVGSLPHHALQQLAAQHGPLMHLQLGEVSTVVVSSPKMAEEVMKTHDIVFAQRPELPASQIISYGGLDIVFSKGEYWKQMRKVCTTELLGAKRVQSFASIREDEVSNLIESIHLSAGLPVNLTQKIFLMISNITSRSAFGNKCVDQEAFISLVKEVITVAGGFNLGDFYPSLPFLQVISGMTSKLQKLHRRLDNILDKIINEHNEKMASAKFSNRSDQVEKEDLVDVLLKIQQNRSLECHITTNHIKAVIWTVFAAGMDTTTTTVEWAMLEMMRNPGVMEKAQAEIQEALEAKGKKTICEADTQELKYLKSVIKETLRLHPPAPLLAPRESRESCEIDGYEIPVKTRILVNVWAIGRDAEYWNDAESFTPERFDDSSVDFKGMNFEYIPFGAGRRICPGILFGLANVELALAQLLCYFKWKIPDGITQEDLKMIDDFGGTTERKNLYLIPTPYAPSQ